MASSDKFGSTGRLAEASKVFNRSLVDAIPPQYRDTYRRVASAVGTVLGILVLLIAAYTLLQAALYVVGPVVGMTIPANQYTNMSRVLQFVVLALAWDLIGGQTGYASFGNIVFFGMGVYTVVVLMNGTLIGTYGFPVAFLAAGIVSLVYALALGLAFLRLRGHYFGVATLGILVATQQYIANLEQTGGGSGVSLPLPGFENVDRVFFLLFGLLAVITAAVYWYLMRSRVGFGFNAIRDDEDKAAAMGIHTTKYKLIAWGVSGLFTGFAGALFAYQNSYVSPGVGFNIDWSILLIMMALIGGMGRLWGPIVGAAFLWTLRNTLWSGGPVVSAIGGVVGISLRDAYLVIFGVILVLVVLGAPNGILGYLRSKGLFDSLRDRIGGIRDSTLTGERS